MSEQSSYWGPERAKYPHLEERADKDIRADVEDAFIRVEKAWGVVEEVTNDPSVSPGSNPSAWARFIVGTVPAGAFASMTQGQIAVRKRSGTYTEEATWHVITPDLGSIVMNKDTNIISYCSSVGPPAIWTALPSSAASSTAITDAALYYAGATVELALAELAVNIGGVSSSLYAFTTSGAPGYCTDNTAVFANLDAINEGIIDIKNTVAGEGASLVGLETTAYFNASTEVQTALETIGAQLGGTTESTYVFTQSGAPGYCTDSTSAFANINALNNALIDIKNTVAGEGAALIGLETTGYFNVSTEVQTALETIGAQLGGATESTYVFTQSGAPGYCTDSTSAFANINALNNALIDIKNTVAGEGAALIGLETTGYFNVSTEVQTALETIGAQVGGSTESTYAFTVSGAPGYCTDDTSAFANINALNDGLMAFKTFTTGTGAELIGVEDATGFPNSTSVQTALELMRTNHVPFSLNALTGEDGTALTTTAGAAQPVPGFDQLGGEEVVLRWSSHAAPEKVSLAFTLLNHDASEDLVFNFLACLSAANDTPDMEFEAYIQDIVTNKLVNSDVDCGGPDPSLAGTTDISLYTMTIANADIPAGPIVVNINFGPKAGQLGNDDVYLYGMWVTQVLDFA